MEENLHNNNGEGQNSTTIKQKIYNLIIVDESGSMSLLRNATMSGVNETLNTIKNAQAQFGDKQEHFVTLVTFDSRGPKEDSVRVLIDAQPIGEVAEFDQYMPHGCTPLYDAMGMSIGQLRRRIEGDDTATGVVTVLTDGLENASQEWNSRMVKELIEDLKEKGWTFSYLGSNHDVKSVADLLSIDFCTEFQHDSKSTQHSWDSENRSKMHFFRSMNALSYMNMSVSERRTNMRQMSRESYNGNITPQKITSLQENEVFVFGSNPMGQHDGGAAKYALEHFGAIYGQGEGMQGQSYAIPTTGGRELMAEAFRRFLDYAETHPEKKFLVTTIGCGSAGYSPSEIVQILEEGLNRAIRLENVYLPQEFIQQMGIRKL